MSDVKTAPCPYCGSTSVHPLRQTHTRGDPFAVICCRMDVEDTDNLAEECGAQGPYSASAEGAVTRWNEVAELKAEIEKLKAETTRKAGGVALELNAIEYWLEHPHMEPHKARRAIDDARRIIKKEFGVVRMDDGVEGVTAVIEAEARVTAALDVITQYGGFDGGHHKQWVIDQAVRALTGDDYAAWVKEQRDGEDGPDTYEWDEGRAP